MRFQQYPEARIVLTAALAIAAIGGGCRDPYFERSYAEKREMWAKQGIAEKDMPTFDQWTIGYVPGTGKDKGKLVDTMPWMTKTGPKNDTGNQGGGEGGGEGGEGGGH